MRIIEKLNYKGRTMLLNNNLIFGMELEGHLTSRFIDRSSPDFLRTRRERASYMAKKLVEFGIDYVFVLTDESPNVDFEIVFPPMQVGELSKKLVSDVFDAVTRAEGRATKTDCGQHIHICIRPSKDITPDEFTRKSVENFKNHLRSDLLAFTVNSRSLSPRDLTRGDAMLVFIGSELRQNNYAEPMDTNLIKDVIYRYAKHQRLINSFLARSRRDYRMSKNIRHILTPEFDRAVSVLKMKELIGRGRSTKFFCINLEHFTTKETVEFRGHQATLNTTKIFNWIELLMNIYYSSYDQRFDTNTSSVLDRLETVTSPVNPYRIRTLKAKIWRLCRTPNGASVVEIMNQTGAGYQNVRGRISEIRRDYPTVVQYIDFTQYGNTYGNANAGGGYRVLEQYQRAISNNQNNLFLLPEDTRAGTNPMIGLRPELRTWFNDRAISLR